jgi:hypothetical protein
VSKKTACGYTAGEWSTKPDVKANCLTCGWQCLAANAHGLGAQHARKRGHCVAIDDCRVHVYNHEEK